MSEKKAKNHYLGKDGFLKLNCCQSVLTAFAEEVSIPPQDVAQSQSFGGGGAPQGRCGALHAAHVIFRNDPEKLKACEALFQENAGSFKCREIRSLRKLNCVGCVETVASYIEKYKPDIL